MVTGARSCTSPAAPSPAALYLNRSPVGGALRFERQADPATDLEAVTGAYPLDLDSDGTIDLAVLRIGENVLLRGLGDCRFERANEALGFDGGEAWTTAFAATWEGPDHLPTLAFGNYVELDESENWTGCLPERAGPAGRERHRLRSGRSPRAELVHALAALQRLVPIRPARPQGVERPALLPGGRGGEEQLWQFAPGDRPRLYTKDDGWQTVRIWGMGIASQDITGDGHPEVYLTSQGDNKLQTLAAGPSRPDYRDMALATRCHGHDAVHGRRRPALDRLARPVRGHRQRRPGWTSSSRRATSRPRSTWRRRTRPTCFLGRPTARSVEVADEAGIAHLRPRPRRRPRRPEPRRAARPRRGEPARERQALAERGLGIGRRARADGQLAGLRLSPARAEPRRDRGVDRGAGSAIESSRGR